METDNDKPPAGLEQLFRCGQPTIQFAQFIIHMNAQRHEGAGCRVNTVVGARHDIANDLRELQGTGDGAGFARGDDSVGDAAGMPFLTQAADQAGQFPFVEFIDDIGSSGAFLRHTHIQWTVAAK